MSFGWSDPSALARERRPTRARAAVVHSSPPDVSSAHPRTRGSNVETDAFVRRQAGSVHPRSRGMACVCPSQRSAESQAHPRVRGTPTTDEPKVFEHLRLERFIRASAGPRVRRTPITRVRPIRASAGTTCGWAHTARHHGHGHPRTRGHDVVGEFLPRDLLGPSAHARARRSGSRARARGTPVHPRTRGHDAIARSSPMGPKHPRRARERHRPRHGEPPARWFIRACEAGARGDAHPPVARRSIARTRND